MNLKKRTFLSREGSGQPNYSWEDEILRSFCFIVSRKDFMQNKTAQRSCSAELFLFVHTQMHTAWRDIFRWSRHEHGSMLFFRLAVQMPPADAAMSNGKANLHSRLRFIWQSFIQIPMLSAAAMQYVTEMKSQSANMALSL